MFIRWWFKKLDLRRHDTAWHRQDIEDELQEFNEAQGFMRKWSEMSDVVFTYTRGKYYDGCDDLIFPLPLWMSVVGRIYAYPKYTLRWLFFRKVGKKFGKNLNVLRNHKRDDKLERIAQKYDIPVEEFKREVKRLARVWLFLP